ncbi:MAG: hypothetical protein JXA60_03015 [Candidatus Coatesbacteria bacterium]|nr:hypothetical protein [Candidatus Coatesbacteria bacterium]
MEIPSTGIDIGSLFLKAIQTDKAGNITYYSCIPTEGQPIEALKKILLDDKFIFPSHLALCGSQAEFIAQIVNIETVNDKQAEILGIKSLFKEKIFNIINIGGASVSLIQLDEKGDFLDYSSNSLCAAGTGSFLDQQAARLGLTYNNMKKLVIDKNPPSIASRCSVFAKSDLIHRQQEGFSKESLWSGLCKSLTRTFLGTLLRGRPLNNLTAITGGVSQNPQVIYWLKDTYGDYIKTHPLSHFAAALGVSFLSKNICTDKQILLDKLNKASLKNRSSFLRPPLVLKKTRYPDFTVEKSYIDKYNNEVRITKVMSGKIDCYLGIDIGSTSTKLVLIDQYANVILDIYRKTAGEPIKAIKYLFEAIVDVFKSNSLTVNIKGVATTGSGRKMIGQIIGADLIQNEISAHLAGALSVDKTVDTIFEIGGQDSKYILTNNGVIKQSNMNYVCAAGTGSFVEEQAARLGFKLEEIGDVVMGIAPPITSDRCTVFMQSDVVRLLQLGYTREECMAAVLYSVFRNYLNKVVGNRQYNRNRIFFQGATARNKGLVAALENLLNVEVVVSPYCHVLGAMGAALSVKSIMETRSEKTSFLGFSLADKEISLSSEICKLCSNNCTITFANIEGMDKKPSWGYLCGRDPDENKMKINSNFQSFQKFSAPVNKTIKGKKKTIGFPRALLYYSWYPLWQEFFKSLDLNVILSPRTNTEIITKGAELAGAEFCFPIKISFGHASYLVDRNDIDFTIIPHMISDKKNPCTTNSFFCPLVQSQPSTAKATLSLHHSSIDKILSPVIDFRFGEKRQVEELSLSLEKLEISKNELLKAWHNAIQAQKLHTENVKKQGENLIRELQSCGKKAFVIMGRPYNTLDQGACLGLPQKISELGLPVIPMGLLPYEINDLPKDFFNMYWSYGQHIIAATKYISERKNLFPIYFTNFSCGPDSFLISFVEEMMGNKPLLTIELDEHGGDAGYMTRIESFYDVVKNFNEEPKPVPFYIPRVTPEELKGRTIFVPPMHVAGTRLFAAGFARFGMKSIPIETETYSDLEEGRKHSRGGECLPCATTLGSLINCAKKVSKGEKYAFFMPSADGPCRFGQYNVFHRRVLDKLGFVDLKILSPSAGNSYQGLSQSMRQFLWKAMLAADIVYKFRLKTAPYEKEKGSSESLFKESLGFLEKEIKGKGRIRESLTEIMKSFIALPKMNIPPKPLVGIVGEIYVRCNQFSNDRLVESIEKYGGEAWVSPIGEWVLYTAYMQEWQAKHKESLLSGVLVKSMLKNFFLHKYEKEYYKSVEPLLHDRFEPDVADIVETGSKYIPRNFYGESILTLGRAALFKNDGAKMIVNVAPFTCMPGLLTSALMQKIQIEYDIPIVSMFYDGESGLNEKLKIYLENIS